MENNAPTATWPDLAIAIFDRLSERNAEITYELANMEIHVPSKTGGEGNSAKWIFNGALKIRTSNDVK
ncbi:MAG: hypothetical protein NWT08_13485 [Akkermansiaceae bacterium]|nr:hypothetical protein [Akkermansiaceae bacterium]MDP4647636.1 hypothetical protein [Akkermansiaceae bacterium]MDP4722306.1 hypothetical protein [Akkermansiaceae bacterium]MDP4780346.1 hypothetical protein [Akkermansiaceae bacterium]MDP4846171.1 hypothetical protein [Akkermansiaceae bacterium]